MKTLFRLNAAIGVVWFLLNVVVFKQIDTDLMSNDPLTEKEYLQKGGNAIDYNIGYAFLTSTTDQVRYGIPEDDLAHQNLFPRHLRNGSLERAAFILGPTLIWLIGCMAARDSANRRIENVTYEACGLIAITTAMSLYGAYYTVVYVTTFWLL